MAKRIKTLLKKLSSSGETSITLLKQDKQILAKVL